MIKDEATKAVREETLGGKTISKKRIAAIYTDVLDRFCAIVDSKPPIVGLPDDFSRSIVKLYRTGISSAMNSVFSGIPFSKKMSYNAARVVGNLFENGVIPVGDTGIVIAGFGEKEFIPHLRAYKIFAVVKNKLVVRAEDAKSFPRGPTDGSKLVMGAHACLIPFAQTDVVETFVEGISIAFRTKLTKKVSALLDEFQKLVLAKCSVKITKGGKQEQELHEIRKNLVKKLQSEVRTEIRRDHIDPLVEVVGVLPKDELANLASALIELTSVKRKMSLDLETVGGPVDVAVISKGDGFIWIKRKHYFKQELNVHFDSNYFREME